MMTVNLNVLPFKIQFLSVTNFVKSLHTLLEWISSDLKMTQVFLCLKALKF